MLRTRILFQLAMLLGTFLLPCLESLAQAAVPPAIVEFATDQFRVRNIGEPASIRLRRSGNTNLTALLEFTARPGTAIPGVQFVPTNFPVRFAIGQLNASVDLPILLARGLRGDTTVELRLSSPGENTLVGAFNTATLTILDVNQVGSSWASFGLDHYDFLQRLLFGIPLWQYAGSLIYIILAFLLSKFIDYLVRVKLQSLARRTATQWDDLMLQLLHGPVKVVAFVIFLHVGLRIYRWPDWLGEIFKSGLHIVVAFSLTYVLLKAIDLALGHWRRHAGSTGSEPGFDQQLFPVIRISLRTFIVVVAILLTSQNLGLNISSVLASLSIGGLALGLAAQDTIANLFGAVSVFVDKPFQIGDRIRIDAVEGIVESIGLRSTRVRNNDGFLVTIPNKTMGNATIVNISRRPTIRTEFNLGLPYDTSPERLRRALQILEEIYRAHPQTSDLVISFNRFGDSALNILVVHQWNGANQKEYLAAIQEFNLQLKQRFDQEGIGFAFPTQTLFLRSESRTDPVSKA